MKAGVADNDAREVQQTEVLAEGVKQEAAYNKLMCCCKTDGGVLSESIQAAKEKIDALTTSIKADT